MKIVLPVHHYPPRYSAGAELYTLRLARSLQAQGHDVEVVCVEAIDHSGDQELLAIEDRYEDIPVWRLAFNMLSANYERMEYDNPLLGAWFRDYLRKHRPDVIHFQAGYLIGVAPLVAAHAAGVPTVLTLHDYWFLCPRITLQRGDGALCEKIPEDPAGCAWCNCLDSRRYRLPDRFSLGAVGQIAQRVGLRAGREQIADRRARVLPALALPDVVIAPSHFLAERFAPYVSADRLRVSRYGLDLTAFQQPRRSSDQVLRIGFVGQVAPHKGLHLLVEAFGKLQARSRSVELHIYGGLDIYPLYVRQLRNIAGDDPRVYFHGRFENSRVAEILSGFDMTVVPSVWYENSPLAILESQAAGTPVITAALGGMAELVRSDVDGLHFRPADAGDLARQLQRLIDDPGLLQSLRSGVVQPRGLGDEVRQLVRIYTNLAARPSAQLQEVA